jgi:hypothetical protein
MFTIALQLLKTVLNARDRLCFKNPASSRVKRHNRTV